MRTYRFGPFSLEKSTLLLCLDGAPLALGPRVVETLLALVERPGEVIPKADLLDRIWPDGYVEEANLAQNVYVIRKTLRAHWHECAIETVPRRGYRFAGEVAVEDQRNVVASRAGRAYRLQAAAAAVLALVIIASSIGLLRAHGVRDAARALPDSAGRLYAMGRFYWSQRTPSGVAKSIRYFQAVLRQDSQDPQGYAGLASAYAIEGDYGFGPLTAGTAFSRAVMNAQRALSLDPSCAEAHAALGLVAVDRQDSAYGEAEYRRAIALDPNYATAHQWYGASLLVSGRTAEAFAELQRAADLDPASVATADWLSEASYIGRRYGDAITYARQTLDLSPERYSGYEIIGLAYEALGNYRAAEAAYRAYERSCSECGYDAAALLAHAYAATHDYERARYELRRAQRGVATGRISSDNVVAALIALGRRNDALHMLRKDPISRPRALLALDPRMDPVRGDSRFRRYMRGPG